MAELLTLDQVAKLLKVSGRHIYNMVSAGSMPGPVRVGRAVRWRADELDGWLKEGCPAVQAAAANSQ